MSKSSQSMRDKVRKNSKENASKDAKYINKPENISFLTVPTDEKIKLNFLPYTVSSEKHPDKIEVGDLWYKRPYLLHRNVGAEEAAIVCPKSVGRSCPICDSRNEISNGKDPDKDQIKALTPTRRVLYVVEPVGHKKLSGIHLLDISYFAFQKLLDKEMADPDNEKYVGFPDVEGGYVVAVRFDEETGGGHKFAKASSIKFMEREDEISSKLLKSVPDLDECLNILSAKEITKLFMQLDDDDMAGDEDEPEEKPRKKVSVEDEDEKPKHKKNVDDDEDDPKDDDDGDPPAKKTVRKEEPEEEDDPPRKKKPAKEEEDDDDPPPRKKKAPVEDDDDDPPAKAKKKSSEDDNEPPMRRGKKAKEEEEEDDPPKKTKIGGGKCPSGYKWGDASKKKTQHDECEDCSVWKSCTKG